MKRWMFLMVVVLGFFGGSAEAEDVKEVFRDALFAEEGERDLEKAVAGYEAVVAAVDAQRGFGASALFRLGECYRKLGREDEAVAAYKRVVAEFAGEAALVAEAGKRLGEMGRGLGEETGLAAVAETEEQRELARLREELALNPDLVGREFDDGIGTWLHRAAREGWLPMAAYLLEAGIDIDATSRAKGRTALHVAVMEKRLAMVEFLLKMGADVNAVDGNGLSVLAAAVGAGGEVVIEALLDAGAKTPQPGEPGREELTETPIGVAVGRRDLVEAERLVELGVDDVRTALSDGKNVLRKVVEAGDVAMAEGLIGLGAELALGDGGEPLLFVAVGRLDAGMVRVLLETGADAGEVWRSAGTVEQRGGAPTPAPGGGGDARDAVVRRLLERAKQGSAGGESNRGRRAVVLPPAGSRGAAGEQGEAGEATGEAILVRLLKRLQTEGARSMGDGIEIFRMLVEAGAEVQAVEPETGRTLLHLAAMLGPGADREDFVEGVVGELMRCGVSVWAVDGSGKQAVSYANGRVREVLWGATYFAEFAGRGDGVWLSWEEYGMFVGFSPVMVDSMAWLLSEVVEMEQTVYAPDLGEVEILRAGAVEWEVVDYAEICESGEVGREVRLGGGDIVRFLRTDGARRSSVQRLGDYGQGVEDWVQAVARPEVVVAVGGEERRVRLVNGGWDLWNSTVWMPGLMVPDNDGAVALLEQMGVLGWPEVDRGSVRVVRGDGSEVDLQRNVLKQGDRVEVVLLEDAETVAERRADGIFMGRESDGFRRKVVDRGWGMLGEKEKGVPWGLFLTRAYPAIEMGKSERLAVLPWPDLARVRIERIDGTVAEAAERWGFDLDFVVPWGSVVEVPAVDDGEREGEWSGLDEGLMLAVAARWRREVTVRVDGGDAWPYVITEADFGHYYTREVPGGGEFWQEGSWRVKAMEGYHARRIELGEFLKAAGYADWKRYERGQVKVSWGESAEEARYERATSRMVLEDGMAITLRALPAGG